MTTPRSLERLRARTPGFIQMMGGCIRAVDPQAGTCTMSFDIGREFCHSVDIVQGGFTTAMLDAAMSHAAFGQDDSIVGLATLEISTRYLEVVRAGQLDGVSSGWQLARQKIGFDGLYWRGSAARPRGLGRLIGGRSCSYYSRNA